MQDRWWDYYQFQIRKVFNMWRPQLQILLWVYVLKKIGIRKNKYWSSTIYDSRWCLFHAKTEQIYDVFQKILINKWIHCLTFCKRALFMIKTLTKKWHVYIWNNGNLGYDFIWNKYSSKQLGILFWLFRIGLIFVNFLRLYIKIIFWV